MKTFIVKIVVIAGAVAFLGSMGLRGYVNSDAYNGIKDSVEKSVTEEDKEQFKNIFDDLLVLIKNEITEIVGNIEWKIIE